MPSSEYDRWLAYWVLEPFGSMRDNLHAGMIASLLYNSNRKRSTPPMTAADFLIKDNDERAEENTRIFLKGLKALAKPGVH